MTKEDDFEGKREKKRRGKKLGKNGTFSDQKVGMVVTIQRFSNFIIINK